MLYVYFGTDRAGAHNAATKAAEMFAKKERAEVVRISDASTLHDLRSALQGAGMFGGVRVVLLEYALENEEMQSYVMTSLPHLVDSEDMFCLIEEKVDAATKRKLEKAAEKIQKFDAPKGRKEDSNIFTLASALRKGDKKVLWVDYQRALSRGERPEALHGILFWGAKRMLLQSSVGSLENERARKLVARLAELPHLARRKSFELEYALESFLLDVNKR